MKIEEVLSMGLMNMFLRWRDELRFLVGEIVFFLEEEEIWFLDR